MHDSHKRLDHHCSPIYFAHRPHSLVSSSVDFCSAPLYNDNSLWAGTLAASGITIFLEPKLVLTEEALNP